MGSTDITNYKVIYISILFNILRIAAENLIKEQDCYLRGDNEIQQSFEDILNLADEFIKFYS